MSLPRLVLVTRRFWPLVGGAEAVMARLAAGFESRGARTTVLTARWQTEWPAELEHHGVRVVRLANPALRGWGTWRYMQALARWLAANRAQYDLVYVSMLKHDAYAAAGAARRAGFCLALRAEGAGLTGDCHWQLDARCGLRIKRRLMQADALVAPSPAIEREMIAAGYPRDRICYVPNGVAIGPPRHPTSRHEARKALAGGEAALALPADAPLVVYTGRLHTMKGLDHLVAAWPGVLSRHPRARLWLVGEGPAGKSLAEQVQNMGLSTSVHLPGLYDDVEDFLLAADVFVLPSLEEGMSLALLEAMAAGLPAVATAIAANQVLIEDRQHGRLVPPANPAALGAAIVDLLDRPDEAARLGAAARARVEKQFSIEQMIDAHLELFDRLLARGKPSISQARL